MEKYNDLKALVLGLEDDAKKFYEKENKSAGVRLRKGLQDLKAMAQELRFDVADKKNKIK